MNFVIEYNISVVSSRAPASDNDDEENENEQEIDEEHIMADTVFDVQTVPVDGLGPDGPQCMSSPLQSPTDAGPDKTGHLTMKSDDSGIMMGEW